MKCYECDKEAFKTEVYNEIDIGLCPDGHRTGLCPKDILEGLPRDLISVDWLEVEQRLIDRLKSNS